MTDHVVRLYAGATALIAFFLVWAVLATDPFATEADADPRVTALERREQQLVRESRRVKRVVDRRFAAYRRTLARRRREIAAMEAAAPAATTAAAPGTAAPVPAAPAAPQVAVVPSPPVTSTGSS
jgi:hypothetical protein